MSAPTAPFPLASQAKGGQNITVTVVLRGIGPSPTFIDGGTTFNSGDPTATYLIPIPAGGLMNNGAYEELCDMLDRFLREGSATVS